MFIVCCKIVWLPILRINVACVALSQSVTRLVGWSVGWSVGRLVGWLVPFLGSGLEGVDDLSHIWGIFSFSFSFSIRLETGF